jgi:hypothetical protein
MDPNAGPLRGAGQNSRRSNGVSIGFCPAGRKKRNVPPKWREKPLFRRHARCLCDLWLQLTKKEIPWVR